MAAKTWELDFRYPAIEASIPRVREGYLDDPFRLPGSFCIPVAVKPAVGWTPGKLMLIFLVLGFALLGAGAFLASIAQPDPKGPTNGGILALAVICSLSGMGAFFAPLVFDKALITWLIGRRARDLVERAGTSRILTAEISDADQARIKLSIDGDDHVMILPDEANRRILMEGTAARYQIRAEDVERLVPFEFMNYVGVEVVCRIEGESRLRMAVARVSLLLELMRQLPFLFFLRGRISNKLFDQFSAVLLVADDSRGLDDQP